MKIRHFFVTPRIFRSDPDTVRSLIRVREDKSSKELRLITCIVTLKPVAQNESRASTRQCDTISKLLFSPIKGPGSDPNPHLDSFPQQLDSVPDP
jgi:hypothetical protein